MILSLAAALTICALSILIFGSRGPFKSGFKLLILLFGAAWAGGMWFNPSGPPVWAYYWIPFFGFACLFWILLAVFPRKMPAVTPPMPESISGKKEKPPAKEKVTPGPDGLLNAFFWLLLLTFAIAVAVKYAMKSDAVLQLKR